MVIFVHTIKALKTHFENAAKNRGVVFKPEDVLYVFTVPAIWSESAKEFMKKAAIKVSYLDSRCMHIHLITNSFNLFEKKKIENALNS